MKHLALIVALSLVAGCKGSFGSMPGTVLETHGNGKMVPITNPPEEVVGTPCIYYVMPTRMPFATYEEAMDWKDSAWRTGFQKRTIVEHCPGRRPHTVASSRFR